MDFYAEIKRMVASRRTTIKTLAKKLNMKRDNLSKKIKRPGVSLVEAEKIAQALGCHLELVDDYPGSILIEQENDFILKPKE